MREKLLTIPQAADELGVSSLTIRRLIRQGTLEAIHIGHPLAERKTLRIMPSAIDAFLEQARHPVADSKPRKRGRSMARRLQAIREAKARRKAAAGS